MGQTSQAALLPGPLPEPPKTAELARIDLDKLRKATSRRDVLSPPEEPLRSDDVVKSAARAHQMLTQWHGELMKQICEVERLGIYEAYGCESTPQWVSLYLGMSLNESYRLCEAAFALNENAQLRESYEAGKLSFSQVKWLAELTHVMDGPQLSAVIEAAEELDVGATWKLVQQVKEITAEDSAWAKEERWVETRWDEQSRCLYLFGRFPEDEGAKIVSAIDRVAKDLPDQSDEYGEKILMGAKRAQALAELADAKLGELGKPTMYINIDHETLISGRGNAEIEGGPYISCETASRLLCDANIVPIYCDENATPISAGRSRRSAPDKLRRVLMKRDKRCRFPGCRRRHHLIVHHIKEWATDGGPTDYHNLVMLCSVHHPYVHELGYKIRGKPPNIWVIRPDGTAFRPGPPPITEENRKLFEEERAASEGIPTTARGP